MSVEAEFTEAPETVRERIVRAARRCFLRNGSGKTSMWDVADEAGLSRGTLYRYFTDRADLIEAVFTHEAHLFLEGIRRQIDRFESLEEKIVEWVGILASFEHEVAAGMHKRIDVSPERLAQMLTTRSGPLLRATVDLLAPWVAAAQKRGEVRAELDPRRAAEWIARGFFAIPAMPAVSFRGEDAEAWKRFYRDHVIRGLRP